MRVEFDENYSLARIEDKCIRCGLCLEKCKEINNIEGCIHCGQCIQVCPTGALVIKEDYDEVIKELNSDKIVVVSTSPAVRVAVGDAFGFEPGTFLEKKLVGVLKKLGFRYVFDTTFGADLTIMEEAQELIKRINNKEEGPMFTSCCPSWVRYMEAIFGKDLDKLSTCKSPIGMQASIIKEYFSEQMKIDKENIVSVFLTPCVSKKSEIKRRDIDADYVITTKELELMIREKGLDFALIEEDNYDSLLGKGSGAGLIFGVSGGVMEAALRCAYFLLNQEQAPIEFYHLEQVRGNLPFKEAQVDLKKMTIKVAVIDGISNVQKYYFSLREYQFVEVMSCPGGCIGGAGQATSDSQVIESRMNSLYQDDQNNSLKNCFDNPEIRNLYLGFLTKEKAHKLLHTTYESKVMVNS